MASGAIPSLCGSIFEEMLETGIERCITPITGQMLAEEAIVNVPLKLLPTPRTPSQEESTKFLAARCRPPDIPGDAEAFEETEAGDLLERSTLR